MEYTLRTGDGADKGEHNRLPVMLVLDNLRSAYNVGNLFRVAEATCASGICACGYTAFPPHIKLEKTARGCDALVPCWHYETAAAAILELRKNGYSIYGVETVENAPMYWEAAYNFPAAFVLGNEALGISADALALCDAYVSLPAFGVKNSINVGNCGAVILFDCVRRFASEK